LPDEGDPTKETGTGGYNMAGISSYQNTTIKTATAMELVLMVYNECITTLEKAEKAFDIEGPERIERIGNNLLHAQDCITELALSLDMEQGGEIAENLSRLYDFMTRHLSQANVKKEKTPVTEVKEMMLELRGSWEQVAQQAPSDAIPEPEVNRSAGRINIAG
jgi:flagellar secretion chaperone FliS